MGTGTRSDEAGSGLVLVALEREGAEALVAATTSPSWPATPPGLEAVAALRRALDGDEHEEEKILRLGIEALEELLGRQTVLVTELSSDSHVALLRLLNLLRSQEVDHG